MGEVGAAPKGEGPVKPATKGGERPAAWCGSPGTGTSVQVTLGLSDGSLTEVSSGELKEGPSW
jgi:hypothetical protein